MVIKINGQPIEVREIGADVEGSEENEHNAPKLRRLAITLWITSGALLLSYKKAMAADDVSDTSDSILNSIQDLAIAFGAVAIVTGLILLVFKKEWGVKTLQTTSIIVGGAFLAQSAILLIAIIAYSINGHLSTTFEQMRAHQHH